MASQQSGHNDIEKLDREYTLRTWTRQHDCDPTEIVDTEGARIVTADGDSILDFSSQYVCTSLGYDTDELHGAVFDIAEYNLSMRIATEFCRY